MIDEHPARAVEAQTNNIEAKRFFILTGTTTHLTAHTPEREIPPCVGPAIAGRCESKKRNLWLKQGKRLKGDARRTGGRKGPMPVKNSPAGRLVTKLFGLGPRKTA
jgi:hypothetical protein